MSYDKLIIGVDASNGDVKIKLSKPINFPEDFYIVVEQTDSSKNKVIYEQEAYQQIDTFTFYGAK